ncbi:uncharacterized protein LOC111692257 [Anoplophora glabripennis]|uniref:uncharacterized protein LOC111692257 n=1 Tax=Anoplophora glabripennis TaxID=217634 RepID=UPI000C75B728|nr:uncharacterized protein LOC111692257 [Anoplophora glabripennis]
MPFKFTTAEYADMVFVLGNCDGNATLASLEYQRRFPNRRIPSPKTFTTTFHALRETGSLPSVRIHYERVSQQSVVEEENILAMAERNPGVSTRRISTPLVIPNTRVWRTLNKNLLYPYHLQRVQHLEPEDFPRRVEFCQWLNNNRNLYRYILFTDESQFTRDGINNTHNMHQWSDVNPHATVESNFQRRFSVNVWCGMLYDQLIGPFIIEGRLNGPKYLQFLEEEPPRLLEDVPLARRLRMYLQHDGTPPHISRIVTAHLNEHTLVAGSVEVGHIFGQLGLQTSIR